MTTAPKRVRRNLKANTGRIIRVEQLVGRLEKRIERLESENAALRAQLAPRAADPPNAPKSGIRAELAKLRARVDETAKLGRQTAADLARLDGLRGPMRALVRSFKETPGAPFSTWRVWMLSTFRKQGIYRRQMFK